jgi:hypothetical protein
MGQHQTVSTPPNHQHFMDRQTKPLESEERDRPAGTPRGMLGRIRKATGDFDFSALISGGRQRSTAQDSAGRGGPVPTIEYNPLYEPDPTDTVPPLSKLWEAPPMPPAREEPAQIPEWERARPAPTTSRKPYPGIYEPIDDEPAYVRVARARSRRRHREPYVRSVVTRLLLCVWAVLFGGCLGAGGGPIVERFGDYRALPVEFRAASQHSTPPAAAKPARPARQKRSSRQRHAARPVPSRKQAPQQPVDPLAPYRSVLLLPLLGLAAISLLWILGAPDLLGDWDRSGYMTAAFAVFGLSIWCGLTGMMITLELRASRPTTPSASHATAQVPRLAFPKRA